MARDLPQGVNRELQVYFRDTRFTSGNPTCVVTANTDYTWHHLNHVNDDHRLSNIVPLAGRLNINLFNAKNDLYALDPELECAELKKTARDAFWREGQVARAFGCARIAYYVAQYKNASFSDQLDYARQALYYARHKPNYRIVEDLVAETVLKPLEEHEEPVSPEVVRSLLQEFEALLTLGGDTKGVASLSEYSRNAIVPQDKVTYAGAIRRTAHSLGLSRGPTEEVLNLLDESASVVKEDVNQRLNVASSKNNLYLGEDTAWGHRKLMEIASEHYEDLLVRKIDVHSGFVWPKSKARNLPTLPILTSPANIAHLSLTRAIALAINKPQHWRQSLSKAIDVAEYYENLAGARIDGPGRGNWRRIRANLDSNDDVQLRLIRLINDLVAAPFPTTLTESINQTAKMLVKRLR